MLVIVKNRNVTFLFKSLLYLKASRSRNILKIDPAERARKKLNCVYYIVNAFRADAKRKSVNAAKAFKQRAFSLHNGHTCLRSYVSETKNSAAVSNHGNEVTSSCIFITKVGIFGYCQARLGNPRRIRNRKIVTVFYITS